MGFHIQGHAGSTESGANLVCAAVSAIAQCTVMGITDVAGVTLQEISMEDGEMRLLLPEGLHADQRKATALLLKTMKIGLDSIALDHGDIIAIYTDAQDK